MNSIILNSEQVKHYQKPEWGATTEQTFIIHLGGIIERHNMK